MLYTSNNALVSAFGEQGKITPVRDAEPPVALAQNQPCILLIDSAHPNATTIFEWLAPAMKDTPCAALILHQGTSALPAELSDLEGRIELCVAPFRLGEILDIVEKLSVQLTTTRQGIGLSENIVLFASPRELRQKTIGNAVTLTEKEVMLLVALHQAGAMGLSKEALLEAVWGYQEGVDTHTLETHIYRLRQKIKDLTSQDTGIAFKDGTYTIDF